MRGPATELRQALASLRAAAPPRPRRCCANAATRSRGRGRAPAAGIVLLELGSPAPALLELDAVAPLLSARRAALQPGIALAALGRLEEAAARTSSACALKPDLRKRNSTPASAARARAAWSERTRPHRRLRARARARSGVLASRTTSAASHCIAWVAPRRRWPPSMPRIALQPPARSLEQPRQRLHDLRRLQRAGGDRRARCACSADFPEATNNRGMVLQDLRRFDEAEAAYTSAIGAARAQRRAAARRAALRLLRGASGGLGRLRTLAHDTPRWTRVRARAGGAAKRSSGNRSCCRSRTASAICCSSCVSCRACSSAARASPWPRRALARAAVGLRAALRSSMDRGAEPRLPLLAVEPAALAGPGARSRAEAMPYLRPSRSASRWSRMLDPACINVGIAWQGNPARRIDRGRSIPLRNSSRSRACPACAC
jgi:tetratricopeptide (TPR) repeat protein